MYSHSVKESGNWRYWIKPFDWIKFHSEIAWGKHIKPKVEFGYDTDHGWEFSFSIPYFAFYIFVDIKYLRCSRDRELSLSYHDASLWWYLWVNPMGGHRLHDWRRGSFHFDTFFLGKTTCNKEVLEEREILIPMPEKSYKAHAKLILYTWTRPR